MDWQPILTILIPILSFMGWVYARIEKRADERFHELKNEIKDLRKDIQSLDSRVSRIEGQLIGPFRFEPKIVEVKEE